MKAASFVWTAVSVAALALTSDIGDAQACGGFFRRGAVEVTRTPSLAYEQALIIFDAEARREHFIREVVFRESREPFGFVVPTPARPDVAQVMTSPFAKLHKDYPFDGRWVDLDRAGGKRGGGGGSSVQVLEEKRVGSFTAFVLAADDEQALSGWLSKNGFVSSKPTDDWLAHYVKLGFFYVAMRYEPPDDPGEQTAAETVRISFDAPLPYYPYLEPENPGAKPNDPRMLDLWLVAKRRYVPVAMSRHGGQSRWVRPMKQGVTFSKRERGRLESSLGTSAQLLPGGEDLVVQRFADQKRSRTGFGDVVFVPSEPVPVGKSAREALLRFVPLLGSASAGPAP